MIRKHKSTKLVCLCLLTLGSLYVSGCGANDDLMIGGRATEVLKN